MIINNYIMHKLDKSNSEAILSSSEGRISQELDKFLQKLIKRTMKDDSIRKCTFNDYEENVLKQCTDNLLYGEDFLSNSKEIATNLFDVMGVSGDIESGALIVSTFTEKDDTFVAILKLDYKEVFTQAIKFEDDEFDIQIGMNSETLSDRVKMGAIVTLNGANDEFHLKVIDKDAEKDGCDSNFVKEFLNATKVVDDVFRTRVFMSKAENWITNALSAEDVKKAEDMKSLMAYTLKEKEELDVESFMSTMGLDGDLRDSFKEHMEDCNIDTKFEVDKKWVEKKLKKRKVKMDNGFTINADLADFEDPMKYSIRKNENGSSDIVIKNVNFIEG